MRADRLISLLMLLQTKGQMTAQDLAERLEVSMRTIYRDLDALSASGVPVYAERGPQGGCFLMDSYRTNLTGLNENEVRALFMFTVPPTNTTLMVEAFGEGMYHLITEESETLANGRLQLTIPFASQEDACRKLLGLGTAVTVIHPPELIHHLTQTARAVAAAYSEQ